MANRNLSDLFGKPQVNRTGVIVDLTDNDIRVQFDDEVKTLSRTLFSTVNNGDQVLVQGSSIVGVLKKQPAGKIFQV